MTLGGERNSVQGPLIRYVREAGWQYLSPDEAREMRQGGNAGTLLKEVVVSQLQRLNSRLDHEKAREVVERMKRVAPSREGNRAAWEYLKGLSTVFLEADKQEVNVKLLDPENVEANAFHVTDEFTFTESIENRAP